MPLTCTVVTPERTAFEEQADSVTLPLYDGEAGILPGHAPMIGRLGFGEMRLRTGGTLRRYYVDGGFVQVSGDVVAVLTDRALTLDQLDASAARAHLDEALKLPSATPAQQSMRERSIAQARAQLYLAEREAAKE